MFNPEAVEDTAALFANEEVDQDDEPIIPIRQQQLLATIRDTSLDLLPKDHDDDNMTELTSRTDDDVVRDAFKFLNREEAIEDVDEEEDEIVWDPRYAIDFLLYEKRNPYLSRYLEPVFLRFFHHLSSQRP